MRILATIAIACLPALAQAQAWPSKPIRMIVPFPAGGGTDFIGRLAAKQLSDRLGQPVFVDNRGGANGSIGVQAMMQSAPDGYTLGAISDGPTVINPVLYEKNPYHPLRDFLPVAQMIKFPSMLVANPSVPVKNVAELIALAKAKPGALNYASAGTGTPYHMAAELFKKMTDTDIVHVPHKAAGDSRNAVIGGHIEMMFDAITTMASNVQAGQVRALGTTATTRSKVLADVPTIAEAGVPGFEATIWLGLMAPAGTPKPIVDKLNAAINQTISRPEIIAAWDRLGAIPMTMTPAELDAFLRKDIEKWAQVAKFSGAIGQ